MPQRTPPRLQTDLGEVQIRPRAAQERVFLPLGRPGSGDGGLGILAKALGGPAADIVDRASQFGAQQEFERFEDELGDPTTADTRLEQIADEAQFGLLKSKALNRRGQRQFEADRTLYEDAIRGETEPARVRAKLAEVRAERLGAISDPRVAAGYLEDFGPRASRWIDQTHARREQAIETDADASVSDSLRFAIENYPDELPAVFENAFIEEFAAGDPTEFVGLAANTVLNYASADPENVDDAIDRLDDIIPIVSDENDRKILFNARNQLLSRLASAEDGASGLAESLRKARLRALELEIFSKVADGEDVSPEDFARYAALQKPGQVVSGVNALARFREDRAQLNAGLQRASDREMQRWEIGVTLDQLPIEQIATLPIALDQRQELIDLWRKERGGGGVSTTPEAKSEAALLRTFLKDETESGDPIAIEAQSAYTRAVANLPTDLASADQRAERARRVAEIRREVQQVFNRATETGAAAAEVARFFEQYVETNGRILDDPTITDPDDIIHGAPEL